MTSQCILVLAKPQYLTGLWNSQVLGPSPDLHQIPVVFQQIQ